MNQARGAANFISAAAGSKEGPRLESDKQRLDRSSFNILVRGRVAETR